MKTEEADHLRMSVYPFIARDHVLTRLRRNYYVPLPPLPTPHCLLGLLERKAVSVSWQGVDIAVTDTVLNSGCQKATIAVASLQSGDSLVQSM